MIRTHSCLVSPKDGRLFLTSQTLNSRIPFLEPAAYSLGVSFVGAAHRFLGRKPPTPQVAAHRPDRKSDSIPMDNQIPHCLTSPQSERHLELIWAAVGDHLHDSGRLIRFQRQYLRPAAWFRHQRCQTAFSQTLVPPVHGAARQPKDSCSLSLRNASTNGPNNTHSQPILVYRGHAPRVQFLHASYDSKKYQYEQYLCSD